MRSSPFETEEFRSRLARVHARMADLSLDALVIHSPENMYYLAGYETAGYYRYLCLIVPTGSEPLLVTRVTEDADARAHAWFGRTTTYTDFDDPVEFTALALRQMGLGTARLGVEKMSWFLTVARFEQLQALLPAARFTDGSGIVESCRAVKSEQEVAYIRQAARAAELGMAAGLGAIRAGATEDQVAAEIQRAGTLAGSEYPSLPPFVTSGPRTSVPLATWSGRRIGPGDPVLLEVPGCVRRYGAALMRSVVVAPVSAELRRMAEVSRWALEAMLHRIQPGRPMAEAWHAWAKVVKDAGFFHQRRTGYSIGVNFPPDWGEAPILAFSPQAARQLEPNMTFHIPSNVQVFDIAMMSTSETVLVTSTGCEVLTSFDRQLAVR
jgi:Xaa-Pro dipeptidase